MPNKPLVRLICGVAFASSSALATAQSTDALVDKYTMLAGSKDNARILVGGLRNSDDFKIGDTAFATPMKKLGNGEVNIALSLAEAKLGEQNVAEPTAAQLKAALEPILQMRADGKGWGVIANSLGFRLGDLMRADQARQERIARSERADRHFGRPDKPERPERPERPEKPERADRGR
jgi:hypothetical protein